MKVVTTSFFMASDTAEPGFHWVPQVYHDLDLTFSRLGEVHLDSEAYASKQARSSPRHGVFPCDPCLT